MSYRSPAFRRRRSRHSIAFFAIVAAVTLIFVTVIGLSFASYNNETVHNDCTVTEKDRTTTREGGSDARVYTENCGVFQVGDALFKGHFRSADVYASIDVGKTYDFTTIGFRAGPLSMFPNIIEVNQSGGFN